MIAVWKSYFQYFALLQVTYCVGTILMIIAAYLPHAGTHPRRRKHVLYISLSYVILLILSLRWLYLGEFYEPSPLWEMSVAALFIAYFTGDIALFYMLGFIRDITKQASEHIIKEVITNTTKQVTMEDDKVVQKTHEVQTEIKP